MKLHAFIIVAICITAASSIFPDDFGDHIRSKRTLTNPNEYEESPLLPRLITPVGYHVFLHPVPKEGYFQGRVEVNISCLRPTTTVILHAGENLKISKPEISVVEPRESFGDYRKIKEVSVQNVLRGSLAEWCEVKLSDYLQQGLLYQLTMEFRSDLRNGNRDEAMYYGNFSNDFPNEKWFVATNMRENKARKVFPCFDELSYKAPFVINVGRPGKMKSLSNMALRKSEKMLNQPGWVWDVFETTPPMSTFSVNLFIFDPDSVVPLEPRRDLGSTTLHIYAPVELRGVLQNMSDTILQTTRKIETYLQTKYPLPDLQIVVVPGITTSHEGFGLSIFSDEERNSWPYTLLREMGDQWLIHLTTPHSWSDILFGNSLSMYVSFAGYNAAVAGTRHAQPRAWGTYYSHIAQTTVKTIISRITTAKPHISHTSNIGLAVLRMLNYTLGENTLRSALSSFLHDRLYKTFVSNDVVAAIEDQAQRHLALPAGVTVSKLVDSWMKSWQIPIVNVVRNYQTRVACVVQEAFYETTPDGSSDNLLWYVPLVLLRGDQTERSLDEVLWMQEERVVYLEHMPPTNSFILIDPDAIGVFLVNYDAYNWRLLTHYLQTNGYSKRLSGTTRAKLLTDAALLASVGVLPYDVPLDLSLMLEHETDVQPFDAFHDFFWDLHDKWQCTNLKALLMEYILTLFSPLYKACGGYNEDVIRDYSSPYRVVMLLMCRYGVEDCVAASVAKYKPGNVEYEDCVALCWGDRYIWDETLIWSLGHNKNNKTDSRVLKVLASCTLHEDRIEKLMEAVLLKYFVSNEDVLLVVDEIDNPYALLQFLSHRWLEIKKKYEHKPEELWNLVRQITTKFITSDGYDLVSEFSTARQYDTPSLLPLLRNAMKTIDETMKVAKGRLSQTESWLRRFLGRN